MKAQVKTAGLSAKPTRKETVTNLVLAALFAALTTVMTAYIFHIPDAKGGYTHIGDGIIYLAGAILPMPYAVAAGAIGAGLADLLTAPMWILPTVIIKAIMVLPFTSKSEKIICVRNVVGVFVGGIITIVGYCLAEAVLVLIGVMPGGEAGLGAVLATSFALSFPSSIIQPLGSGILFIALGLALDGIKFNQRFVLSNR